MLTSDMVRQIEKDKLSETAEKLEAADIGLLVGLLSEKDDKQRYQALLLLQQRSAIKDDVYPYMEVFCEKLKSGNSYQRSIGIMLLAANAKWDAENRLDAAMDGYFSLLKDEKPITIRQCIQSFSLILPYKKRLHARIINELTAIDLSAVKDTMRKSVLTDILDILAEIKKETPSDKAETYITGALGSGFLDKKAVKEIEAKLNR